MSALVTTAGSRSVEELLTVMERGRRVVVEVGHLYEEHEVVLRWDGRTFYCDTPTRRHRHETREEMRACMEKRGYASA